MVEKHIRIECPIWHSPLCFIVADGIAIKCRSCRTLRHLVHRSDLEAEWQRLEQAESYNPVRYAREAS